MSIRKTVVAGSFYPNSKKELENYFNQFNSIDLNSDSFDDIKALIVPHAGYVYSGFTANCAYKKASTQEFKRVIVIGPSHRVYLKGASIALYNEYETPLGNLKIDLEYSKKLKDEFDFCDFNIECEFEHSTETQAPFVKHYFPNAKFVEIIYGDCNYMQVASLIEKLLEDESNLVLISTDLSHFHDLKKAKELDTYCLNAIEKKDISFLDVGEACGKIGVQAMIEIANKKSLETKLLHYCTSADVTDDKSRVVGYTSAIVGV